MQKSARKLFGAAFVITVALLLFLPLMGALMSGFMRHIAERISAL